MGLTSSFPQSSVRGFGIEDATVYNGDCFNLEYGIDFVFPTKLRFENARAKKMLKQAWTFSWLLHLFVTTMGFEPTRPFEHHPLKVASLPISPRGLKTKKAKQCCSTFCDPTGARTQDPNIKSVVLYQLSYRVYFPFLNAGANIRPYYLYFKAILL